MSANGFTNPSAAQVTSANLLFYKNNLTLVSSARGLLISSMAYVVASSSQINFIGFTALDNEVFTGTIDYTAITGVKVVDARPINATGTLTAATTDFNVGIPFRVGQYGTTQIGSVLVFLDGVLQFRNSSNSSVTLDGNYYEVEAGSGLGNIIRFNTVDLTNDRSVMVIGNGTLSERPDGSMMAVIEAVQGQVNNAAIYVAALAGTTTTAVLGAAPSNVDLKSFGDKVSTLQNLETTPGSGLPKLATASVDGANKLPDGEIQIYTGAGHGSANNKVRRFAAVGINTGSSMTLTQSSTLGDFITINANGVYTISYMDRTNSATSDRMGITKNSANLTTSIDAVPVGELLAFIFAGEAAANTQGATGSISITVRLSAGDVIRAHTNGGQDNVSVGSSRLHITQVARL